MLGVENRGVGEGKVAGLLPGREVGLLGPQEPRACVRQRAASGSSVSGGLWALGARGAACPGGSWALGEMAQPRRARLPVLRCGPRPGGPPGPQVRGRCAGAGPAQPAHSALR